ncbi:hypothetical protein Ocin01_10361 [Orchesella cincta]|uniref:Uncharacterized protein n=1 Tax=Orchesella cincta TaxID=48709 RepID=A0A1D2MT64_ORCCI|nr:hypothetical protein Ocin01_10361 [Orchesella cincta]
MGSLFVISIPVRSCEFRLRLNENKIYLMGIPDSQSDVTMASSITGGGEIDGISVATSDPTFSRKAPAKVRIDASKELSLPKVKDELHKYTVYQDGRRMLLEITRDTMKLTLSDRLPKTTSTTRLMRGSLDAETASKASFDMELTEVINSHFLEKHMEETLTKFKLLNASWEHSIDGRFSHISFTVSLKLGDTIINHLHTVGIGKKYESTLSVCTATVFTHQEQVESAEDAENNEAATGQWKGFVASIKARLTVAQVVQNVKANSIITFDFIVMVLVAACIASLGLLEDSSVNLVASMLISPLMGPIMAFTFGAMIRDYSLIKTGVVAEVFGLSLCLAVGFVFGVLVEAKPVDGPWKEVVRWPTSEMYGRSQLRSLLVGAGIAIPSGAGVALSILAGNAGSLVGVAISASLLPPCVNAGVFYGLATVISIRELLANRNPFDVPCDAYLHIGNPANPLVDHWRQHTKLYCHNSVKEFAIMGTIKEVAPYTTRNSFERFWKHDLKYARDYNKTHTGGDGLLDDLNDEMNNPGLLHEVEDDFVFNQVMTKTMYREENILTNLKEKRSKPTVDEQPPPPANAGWFGGWFKGPPPKTDEEAAKKKKKRTWSVTPAT